VVTNTVPLGAENLIVSIGPHMVVPGMGGRALAELLTELRPGLRVLYFSGYAETDVFDGNTSFVQKPFAPEELSLRVRALIDRPR